MLHLIDLIWGLFIVLILSDRRNDVHRRFPRHIIVVSFLIGATMMLNNAWTVLDTLSLFE